MQTMALGKLLRCCDTNGSDSHAALQQFHASCRPGALNEEKALMWLEMAAESGNCVAEIQLA